MKFKKATKDLDFKSKDGLPQKDKSPFAPIHYRNLKKCHYLKQVESDEVPKNCLQCV